MACTPISRDFRTCPVRIAVSHAGSAVFPVRGACADADEIAASATTVVDVARATQSGTLFDSIIL